MNLGSKLQRRAHVEIGRIALDSNLDVLRLNLTIELLRVHIWRQFYVDVDLFQSLIPLEDLLTCNRA